MPASEEPTSTLRVLVADDRPDVLEAMRLLLKGAGHRACCARRRWGPST
jgi:CheY-like chemotaxis protein